MRKRNQVRIVMLIPALILGGFVLSFLHGFWASYWLLSDPQWTRGEATEQLQHGMIAYKYTVDGREFLGQSQGSVQPLRNGGEVSVVYSVSHPWLSSLHRAEIPIPGILMVLLVLFFESMIVATIINPKGKWALQTGLKQND